MKKIYTLLTAVVLTVTTFAQAPEKMSYQAIVRDAGNALVVSQTVGMQISILQGSATGTPVYVETQTSTTNINGLVSIEIGSGTVVSGTFNGIDWSTGPYFIKTETDPTGGTTYTITGSSQLMSVPYALHANTAENVTNDLVNDADSDPVNEIQVISFSNDTLYLSNGGSAYIGHETPSFLLAAPNQDRSLLTQYGTIKMDVTLASNGNNITRNNDLITLAPGHIYRCSGTVHVTMDANNTWTRFMWYNNTTAKWAGVPGTMVTDNRNYKEGQAPRAVAYFDLSTKTNNHVIRLRHKANALYTDVWGASNQTYCECMQLDK